MPLFDQLDNQNKNDIFRPATHLIIIIIISLMKNRRKAWSWSTEWVVQNDWTFLEWERSKQRQLRKDTRRRNGRYTGHFSQLTKKEKKNQQPSRSWFWKLKCLHQNQNYKKKNKKLIHTKGQIWITDLIHAHKRSLLKTQFYFLLVTFC